MKLSLYVNQHDEVLSQAEVIEHLETKIFIAVEALEEIRRCINEKESVYILGTAREALEKIKS